MYSPAEATNSLPFSSPYPAIPGPLLIQIKMEIIYYIWYDLPDTVNIPVENQRSISASIKPSLGVSGKKNLEGGGGGGYHVNDVKIHTSEQQLKDLGSHF